MINITVLNKAKSYLSLFITAHAQNKQFLEIGKVKVRFTNHFFNDTCSSDHVPS